MSSISFFRKYKAHKIQTIGSIIISVSLNFISIMGHSLEMTQNESTRDHQTNLLPADILSISDTQIFSKFILVVDKSERKLTVYDNQGGKISEVSHFPTDVGRNDGNKSKRDDKRTPEGIYFLKNKLTQPSIPFSQYGKMAFTTDYPNFFDRRQGKTGSGIWLHAIPDSVPLTRGSKGCVVVRNEALDQINQFIKLNETPLLIYDHVAMITPEEHSARKKEVVDFLNSWKKTWESLDLNKYLANYADDFSAPGFNLLTWTRHKKHLKNFYSFIKIDLAEPYVFRHRDNLMIKTFQRYQSDKHTDFGIKTIYATKTQKNPSNETGFKILREEWTPTADPGTYVPWVAN